jgi:hypothetical protein
MSRNRLLFKLDSQVWDCLEKKAAIIGLICRISAVMKNMLITPTIFFFDVTVLKQFGNNMTKNKKKETVSEPEISRFLIAGIGPQLNLLQAGQNRQMLGR